MIELSPSQQRVVDYFPEFLSNEDPEMTISGFAGSGKSFLVDYLATAAEKQQQLLRVVDPDAVNRRLYFTATTNKAAVVLGSMLRNMPVTTIHKLLGLTVQNDFATGRQRLVEKDRVANLTNSLVFIDEASMINLELLEKIRYAQKRFRNCKVVFIGDAYQLPPVMENVCPVFNPKAKNVFFLTEIQRQVANNPIIQLSADYRAVLDDHTLGWPKIPADNKHIFHYREKQDFLDTIKAAYTKPHKENEFKIVAWSNNRVILYNKWIRKLQGMTAPFHIGETMITNKPIFYDGALMAGTDTLHMISDVIPANIGSIQGFLIELMGFENMQLFQPLHWAEASKFAKQLANEAKMTGDWKAYFEVTQNWLDLRPIHASTVHKAQGSTYREVFVDLNNIGENTRWKEVARLVYVAITRASDKVHIFGDLCMNYNKKPPDKILEVFADVNNL